MAIKRLIFIRSGETDWNRLGRWQGWVNVPLNDRGREQAERLAKHIRNIGVGVLYSSDLRRAAQTAEIVAAALGFEPIYDRRLREQDIGQWQGLTIAEIRDWYPDEYARLIANVEGYQIPGGESREHVRSRMLAAYGDVEARGRGETVAVVSHSTTVRVLLAKLLRNYDAFSDPLANMSVSTIARDEEGEWKAVALNDLLHLEGMESHSVQELEKRNDSRNR